MTRTPVTRTHRFTAPVTVDPTAEKGYMHHYVPVPDDVAAALSDGARVAGTAGGARFSRVVTAVDGGVPGLRFGEGWLRDAGLGVGDPVDVELREVGDDHVELPDELAAALDADPAAEHAWVALTPGRRRSLVHPIARAKRTATRQRRVQSLLDELR